MKLPLTTLALAAMVLAGCTTPEPTAPPGGGVAVSTRPAPSGAPTPPVPVVPDDAADIGDPQVDTGTSAQFAITAVAGSFCDTLAQHRPGFQAQLKKLALRESAAKIEAIDAARVPELGKVTEARIVGEVSPQRTDTVVTFDSGVRLDVSVSFQSGRWLVWGWVPYT